MTDEIDQSLGDVDVKLLKELSKRLSEGDVDVGLDLAQFFWGHLPLNEVNLHIAVIETLIRQSAALGSIDSQNYLVEIWPKMKTTLAKRLIRKGFDDKWGNNN
jgi:hypothetical protein